MIDGRWRSRRTKPLGRDGRGRIRWLFPSLRGLITPRFRRGRDQTYFLDSIDGFDRRSPSMPRPIWTSIDDHCHLHFRLSAAPSKPSRSHHVAPSSAEAPIVFSIKAVASNTIVERAIPPEARRRLDVRSMTGLCPMARPTGASTRRRDRNSAIYHHRLERDTSRSSATLGISIKDRVVPHRQIQRIH